MNYDKCLSSLGFKVVSSCLPECFLVNMGLQRPIAAAAAFSKTHPPLAFSSSPCPFSTVLPMFSEPCLVNYVYFHPSVRPWGEHLGSEHLVLSGHYLSLPCVKLSLGSGPECCSLLTFFPEALRSPPFPCHHFHLSLPSQRILFPSGLDR